MKTITNKGMRRCQWPAYPATYCPLQSDPVGRENTALETNDSANGLISHRLSSEGRGGRGGRGRRDMAEGDRERKREERLYLYSRKGIWWIHSPTD